MLCHLLKRHIFIHMLLEIQCDLMHLFMDTGRDNHPLIRRVNQILTIYFFLPRPRIDTGKLNGLKIQEGID